MKQQTLEESLKLSPPITVGAISLFGISLEQWILILTAIYTLLLIIAILRDKFIKPFLENRREKNQKNSDE
nr:hypothetical protein [uncultured Undibacterium sp.]